MEDDVLNYYNFGESLLNLTLTVFEKKIYIYEIKIKRKIKIF
jgi:hypothetical protein